MSSSIADSYAGVGTIQTIYHRLLGRGAPDTKGEKHPNAVDNALSSSFDLMELSSPVATPPKPTAKSLTRNGDEAARTNYDHMFTDPNALDYLMHVTQDSKAMMGDPGKESLLVKFDPLRARRPISECFTDPNASAMSVTDSDCGYNTGSNMSVLEKTVISPKRTASVNIPREKPTQVVNPAVNHSVGIETSRPPLVRSASAIMSPARVAVDRLISYGEHSSPPINLLSNSPIYDPHLDGLHSLKVILQRQERDALQLRDENSDLKYAIRDLEKKLQRAVDEGEDLKEKEKKLSRQLHEKSLSAKQMGIAMAEYEKTISSLIGEQQAEKTVFLETEKALRTEQEQIQAHLLSMESAFNDLLSKYEKCKSKMNEFKELEDTHRKRIQEYELEKAQLEEKHAAFETMASEQLSKANETLDKMKKSHESELMKLNAIIKKYEVQVTSLQDSLTQKIKDNEQLTGICDELISKVH